MGLAAASHFIVNVAGKPLSLFYDKVGANDLFLL